MQSILERNRLTRTENGKLSEERTRLINKWFVMSHLLINLAANLRQTKFIQSPLNLSNSQTEFIEFERIGRRICRTR